MFQILPTFLIYATINCSNQGYIKLLILGKEQYKHDTTFKDVLMFFRDLICEKATSVLFATATFLLGLVNENLYKFLKTHDFNVLAKFDIF